MAASEHHPGGTGGQFWESPKGEAISMHSTYYTWLGCLTSADYDYEHALINNCNLIPHLHN